MLSPKKEIQDHCQFSKTLVSKKLLNMTKILYLTTILFLLNACQTTTRSTASLREQIQKIVSTKNAMVGVSIIGNNGKDTISINGDKHFPMQSVFKFHIALAVLSEVDKGKFSLDQNIKIEKKDLLPDLYSPLREKYPDGVTLSLGEILEYTVSLSDNVGCDLLLRLLGGPKVVENYFLQNDIKDIAIEVNEEEQQSNWDLQFKNWTTPCAANETLLKFYNSKQRLLSKTSYDFIWKAMRETTTGEGRLKAQLPKGTIIAHKTGTSGANKDGVSAAVNDIGIIFLPNGDYFFITVLVTDSKENAATNEKIIADIAKATWDFYAKK